MATTIVLHRVRDYDTWRKVYDEFTPVQKEGGVTGQAVYQAQGDPNNVLVVHHFATMAAAEAFFSSTELLDAMRNAGVEGQPRVEFYEDTRP
jgi:quinol monooxygenase YgiN